MILLHLHRGVCNVLCWNDVPLRCGERPVVHTGGIHEAMPVPCSCLYHPRSGQLMWKLLSQMLWAAQRCRVHAGVRQMADTCQVSAVLSLRYTVLCTMCMLGV